MVTHEYRVHSHNSATHRYHRIIRFIATASEERQRKELGDTGAEGVSTTWFDATLERV